ncbi:MAG: hypothetical protein ABJB98_01700 [Actinomycetota bacterium]
MAGDRATRGDAIAVLDAFGNAGWAVRLHSEKAEGAPADPHDRVAIRPFTPWNGRHFCALDWHTILIADIEGGDKGFTEADAKAVIDQLDANFTLDGVPLQVERTAVKRFLKAAAFDLEVAYYAQWGRVMSPGDLAVGQHVLSVTLGDFQSGPITFFIDPAGEGVCV